MLPTNPIETNPTVPSPKPVKAPKAPKEPKAPKPPKEPKPVKVSFDFTKEDAAAGVLTEIHSLASTLETSNLEFSWKCAEYYTLTKKDSEAAFGSPRKALTETINFLSADINQARVTVADRLRVGLVISRDTYKAIVDECKNTQPVDWVGPTYFQIRACVVTEGGVESKRETNDRINWAVAESWPPAREIVAQFKAKDEKPKLPKAERAWGIMVKNAQIVVQNTGPENPMNKVSQEIMKIWADASGVQTK